MKPLHYLLLIAGFISITGFENGNRKQPANQASSEKNREFYQFKTYTFDTEEQLQKADLYFKEALLPRLKQIGIKNVGVFKLRPTETDTVKKIFLLIPFSSLNQFISLEDDLGKDEVYQTTGHDFLKAPFNKPPYRRIESTLLKAFPDMPFMKAPALDGPKADRVYELRSYESATEAYHHNKVHMFNAGGEINLFESLGFNAVFYAQVISGSKMPNLMYMITFQNQASRDEHWKAFGGAPKWQELKAMPMYQNNVSHIDVLLLYPTDYSDY